MVEKTYGLTDRKQAITVIKENYGSLSKQLLTKVLESHAVFAIVLDLCSVDDISCRRVSWPRACSGQTGQPSALTGCWRGLGLGFGVGHAPFSICHCVHGVEVCRDQGCSQQATGIFPPSSGGVK